MKKSKKYLEKRTFRKKVVFLPKTKFRIRKLAPKLEHRRVEGKNRALDHGFKFLLRSH